MWGVGWRAAALVTRQTRGRCRAAWARHRCGGAAAWRCLPPQAHPPCLLVASLFCVADVQTASVVPTTCRLRSHCGDSGGGGGGGACVPAAPHRAPLALRSAGVGAQRGGGEQPAAPGAQCTGERGGGGVAFGGGCTTACPACAVCPASRLHPACHPPVLDCQTFQQSRWQAALPRPRFCHLLHSRRQAPPHRPRATPPSACCARCLT